MDHSGSINPAVAVCPTCGAAHRAGSSACADRGVGLVPIDAERRPADDEVERGTTDVADRLETSGIGARILIDRYPGDIASPADVCIPSERLEDARELLRIER